MDAKISTVITGVEKEDDKFRLEMMQSAEGSSILLHVSMLISKKTLNRLAAVLGSCDSFIGSPIDLMIENEKCFMVTFPAEGSFPVKFCDIDYPIEAKIGIVTPQCAKGISSFKVIASVGDTAYLLTDYYLSRTYFDCLVLATDSKAPTDLQGISCTIMKDGRCYFPAYMRAYDISIEAKFDERKKS